MSISSDLLLAVLSMDAYNLVYNQTLIVAGSSLENASVGKDSSILIANGARLDMPAGFYAISYKITDGSIAGLNSGETIISYRGSDQLPYPNPFNLSSWADVAAWSIWYDQNYDTPQAQMAAQFYQQTQQAVSGSIELTGHSPGGALAGFVGSIYGTQALVFDNIDFQGAPDKLYQSVTRGVVGTDGDGNPTLGPIDTDAENLYYPTGTVPPVNSSNVTGRRRARRDRYNARSNPTSFIPAPPNMGLGNAQEHWAWLEVILTYAAETQAVGTIWYSAAQYVLPQLYNDSLSNALNIPTNFQA